MCMYIYNVYMHIILYVQQLTKYWVIDHQNLPNKQENH
jgi:hypothetical protein